MFQAQDYTRTVSVKLSEVLADIGVNERIVLKRRRTFLMGESMSTILLSFRDKKSKTYTFGSQSEGTLTIGLCSDFDTLMCSYVFNVIQDWCDWQPGVLNLLMIQDETVSPGYCLLQLLRPDVPLPCDDADEDFSFIDSSGRILFGNTMMYFSAAARLMGGAVRHGPAYAVQGQPGVCDNDYVGAFKCKSWPTQAKPWLDWQGVGQWPSDDMKRYCSNTGCFVVGVGSKCSENEELEWRISTSLAERCLMFNLNITQIRCYVLMKMILKTFIKPRYKDTISSFMCKTVLLQLIANTHSNVWRETNLLACLSLCLFGLHNSVLNENCPHFIIPGNNLMAGRFSRKSKPYILEILQYIINSEGRALLGIECDDLGARLLLKLNNLCPSKLNERVSGHLLKATASQIDNVNKIILIITGNSTYDIAIPNLLKYISKLVSLSNEYQRLGKTACSLMISQICTTLGSVQASLNIQQYNAISEEALRWVSLGLNTDVSSGKLKLASMFYCTGDSYRTEIMLRDIEGCYDFNIVEPICHCHNYICQAVRRGFNAVCDNHNEEALQYAAAFCVIFLPCEINCIPHELQYEMFRSTEEDLAFRGIKDFWMDWAVVDSLPYMYFLQYKTYSCLRRQDDKQRALSKLIMTIDKEPNLGHRETALNLLGQCMEHEERATDALHCYISSLNIRHRNNVATIHICRLVSTLVNDQARN